MRAKKDNYGSGKKLPWHFDNEDGFYPVMKYPEIRDLNN